MYAAHFDYHRPKTLAEATRLLQANKDAKLLAGGHSLIPAMKLRLAGPGTLVDIGAIEELSGITTDGGHLRDRRPHHACGHRGVGRGPGGLPGPGRGGRPDRRCPGAQPRHHRRRPRPRRSRRRLPHRGGGARREP